MSFLQSDDNAINIDNIDIDLDTLIASIVEGNESLNLIDTTLSNIELLSATGNNLLTNISNKVSTSSLQASGINVLNEVKIKLEELSQKDFSTSNLQSIGNDVLNSIDTKLDLISTSSLQASGIDLLNQIKIELENLDISSGSGSIINIPSGISTANLQETQINILNSIDSNLGYKTDSEAETDTGTFSLIALFKRLLSKIDSLGFGNTLDSGFNLDMLTDLATGDNQVSGLSLINEINTKLDNLSTSDLQVSGNNILNSIDISASGINSKLNSVIQVDNETLTPQLIIASKSHICTDNSSSTPLGANQTFIGSKWQDTLDYSEIIVSINTDQNSITDGLVIEWSSNGIHVHETDTFTIVGNVGKTFSFPCNRRYLRIKYTNDGVAQTSFNLETLLKRFASKGSSHRLKDDLNEQDDAIVTKTLIAGKSSAGGGSIVNVKVNPSGALNVDSTVSSSVLPTGASTSILQASGNNILSSINTKVNSTPTGELKVELSGNNTSAFGDINTAELIPLVQLDFIYGINIQLGKSTVVNTGVVDTNSSRLRVQSGTSSTGSAIFESVRPAKYRPGQGVDAKFTFAFTIGVTNSQQEVGVGNLIDGYFFGYVGTSFGIIYRNNSVDTFIPQSSWNVDPCNGSGVSGVTINPTFGNIGRIKYPFLGYGNIKFFIENPDDGSFILVHVIKYVNTTNTVQLTNPNLSFWVRSFNNGNTTNMTIFVGSVGIFLSGERKFLGATWAINNFKTNISTTTTNILTLRNATTYNGVTNRSLLRLKSISFASDGGNGVSTLIVYRNTTLGGSPNYTTINGTSVNQGVTITSGNSVTSYNVAGTTISGGQALFNTTVARNSSSFLDVSDLDIFLDPGSTLTFACVGQSSSTMSIAVNWVEDV